MQKTIIILVCAILVFPKVLLAKSLDLSNQQQKNNIAIDSQNQENSLSATTTLDPTNNAYAQPLTSQIAAFSWTTPKPTYASIEYQTTPFRSQDREGNLFPPMSMAPSQYTKVLSQRHDLCPTDLVPDTTYFVRLW